MSKAERRSQALVQLDKEHALRDGISEKEATLERLKGEQRITSILILDNYLEWLTDRKLPTFPEKELEPLRFLSKTYPFAGGHFPFSHNVLIAAFSQEYWRLYVEATDIEASLASVLGVPPRLFQQLSTLRLDLVRKYHHPKTSNRG